MRKIIFRGRRPWEKSFFAVGEVGETWSSRNFQVKIFRSNLSSQNVQGKIFRSNFPSQKFQGKNSKSKISGQNVHVKILNFQVKSKCPGQNFKVKVFKSKFSSQNFQVKKLKSQNVLKSKKFKPKIFKSECSQVKRYSSQKNIKKDLVEKTQVEKISSRKNSSQNVIKSKKFKSKCSQVKKYDIKKVQVEKVQVKMFSSKKNQVEISKPSQNVQVKIFKSNWISEVNSSIKSNRINTNRSVPGLNSQRHTVNGQLQWMVGQSVFCRRHWMVESNCSDLKEEKKRDDNIDNAADRYRPADCAVGKLSGLLETLWQPVGCSFF